MVLQFKQQFATMGNSKINLPSIELFLLSGHNKTPHFLQNVERALKELNVFAPIKIVDKPDALLRSDIEAVPALRVNGVLVTQKSVPSVHSLIQKVQNILYKNRQSK